MSKIGPRAPHDGSHTHTVDHTHTQWGNTSQGSTYANALTLVVSFSQYQVAQCTAPHAGNIESSTNRETRGSFVTGKPTAGQHLHDQTVRSYTRTPEGEGKERGGGGNTPYCYKTAKTICKLMHWNTGQHGQLDTRITPGPRDTFAWPRRIEHLPSMSTLFANKTTLQ